MFVLFTPYTYIFRVLYLFFILALPSLSSFYYFWLSIEFMALLLIGISYTIFTNSVSQLIVYFLIQSLSSFLILLSYLTSNTIILTLSLFLKLGMFPFLTWYLNSVSRFPNFIFWLTGTLHKLPPLLLLLQFNLQLDVYLLWGSLLATTLVSSLIMLSTGDLRYLLVSSSIGNNSWLLLSEEVNFMVFFSFFFIYSFFLFYLLYRLGNLTKPVLSLDISHSNLSTKWWFYLMCLSGLPPFPIFFVKMLVILNLFLLTPLTYLFLLFLILNCFMIAGYLNFLLTSVVYRYSSPTSFFV
jgi:hypothetical protein